MEIFLATLFLVGGLIILWKSAEVLVDGAVAFAKRLGISPLVIGLTIVAMGTSAPEVAASIAASIRGSGNIAVGNVYGSNIANLVLVCGLASIVHPIIVNKQTVSRVIPLMLVVGLLLLPFLYNLSLSRYEAVLLLSVFVILIFATVMSVKKAKLQIPIIKSADMDKEIFSFQKSLIFIALGLIGLAFGAEGTVRGAVVLGGKAGLSETVIGLTIIAVGTSLPELITSLVAVIKRQDDISIGNVVGSNIFNTLLVIGIAGSVRPFEIEKRLIRSDYWIMIGVSFLFLAVIIIGKRRIGRLSGIFFLFIYAIYIAYLFALNP